MPILVKISVNRANCSGNSSLTLCSSHCWPTHCSPSLLCSPIPNSGVCLCHPCCYAKQVFDGDIVVAAMCPHPFPAHQTISLLPMAGKIPVSPPPCLPAPAPGASAGRSDSISPGKMPPSLTAVA